MPARLLSLACLMALTTLIGVRSAWAEVEAEAVQVPASPSSTEALRGPASIDAGLLTGLPAALGTGQTGGIGAGWIGTRTLDWGVRASWSRASEDSLLWHVTHSETRLRAVGVWQRQLGRGSIGLRLGAGATVVHETRDRHQAARLAQSVAGLSTSAWTVLPGADLELAVSLRISGDWGLMLSAGPSAHWASGALERGWVASMGVAWLP